MSILGFSLEIVMIDDFDDDLSTEEQEAAIREMHRVLQDEDNADFELAVAIWENSQGLDY